MDWYRLYHSARLCLIFNSVKRAEYIRKHHVFANMGENCMVMFRKLPLYPKQISFSDNVWIASNVIFITHDVIHHMLNNKYHTKEFKEKIGRIEIKENVFVGANTTILYDVTIGPNTIVGANSLVNKSISGGGICRCACQIYL